MPGRIKILVGTMTGTAELVAEEVSERLSDTGWDCSVETMDDLGSEVLREEAVFLLCTSTYGQGDVPDNARDFLATLEAKRPDLSGRRYGVIALGDSTYAQTFCAGGKAFDKLLQALGAERVGPVFEHDASAGTLPEEEAAVWVEDWARRVEAAETAA